MIYPVDRAIQPLNNWGLVSMYISSVLGTTKYQTCLVGGGGVGIPNMSGGGGGVGMGVLTAHQFNFFKIPTSIFFQGKKSVIWTYPIWHLPCK